MMFEPRFPVRIYHGPARPCFFCGDVICEGMSIDGDDDELYHLDCYEQVCELEHYGLTKEDI